MTMNDPVCAIGMRLQGKRVVFAGAGDAAQRKLTRLIDRGASLVVIAPTATGEIERMASEGKITLEYRSAEPADFAGAFLAFLFMESDPSDSEALVAAARQHGALVNRADNPDDCDFVLPALTWMNTVHIGVFSESPALSKWVRRHLEHTLGENFSEFVAAFAQIRDRVRNTGLPQETRAAILERLLNEGLYQVYRDTGMKGAIARADAVTSEYTGNQP